MKLALPGLPLCFSAQLPLFAGPVNAETLASNLASPLFFDSAGPFILTDFDEPPDNLDAFLWAPEAKVDFKGISRPPLGQGDKGAQTK